jgi:hypothetical protein
LFEKPVSGRFCAERPVLNRFEEDSNQYLKYIAV